MDKPIILPLATVREYAASVGLRRRQIHPAAHVESGDPVILPAEAAPAFNAAGASYDFPEITETEIPDAMIRSRSNLVTTRDAMLTHELLDLDRDRLSEEHFQRLKISTARSHGAWTAFDPFDVHYVTEAAAFTDATAANYAHWLTEVLPRIATFVRDPENARTPLLLDLDLHANIRKSVTLLAPDQPTYRIKSDALVRVQRLRHVSVTGYVPYMPRPDLPLGQMHHGQFSPDALRGMAAQMRQAVNPPTREGRAKLFIRRTAPGRNLVNQDEIAEALAARGFVVLEPDQLSLEAQIAAFSNARIVVGATGAGLTNLVFCRPDCAVVALLPKFRHLAYRYWRNIAAAAGAGPVIHVLGPQDVELEDPWHAMAAHQNYRVAVRDVLDGVDQGLALTA